MTIRKSASRRSQVAIIETGMMEMDGVFLPYQIMSTGQTMWETYQAKQLEVK